MNKKKVTKQLPVIPPHPFQPQTHTHTHTPTHIIYFIVNLVNKFHIEDFNIFFFHLFSILIYFLSKYFFSNQLNAISPGYAIPGNIMTDGHQSYQNNLPVSYFNSLLFNLFYMRRPIPGSMCQNNAYVAQPGLQNLCQSIRVPVYPPNPYFNANNNNFNLG